MNLLMKHLKGIVVFAGAIVLAWLLYCGVRIFPRVDFSQDYRKIQGIENIIFKQSWKNQCYKRCFWGLKKTERHQADYLDVYSESDDSILPDFIDTDNEIHQAVYSPDKKYILYCEIEYGYEGTGITDDEYCYYRVYEIETGKIITIYQAYREWYHLFWSD